jgi:NADH-quinone oxidoreductase subunit L
VSTTTLAVLVPLLPFLGSAAGLLLGRAAPGLVRPLAVLPALAATALTVLVAVRLATGGAGGVQTLDAATRLTPTGSVPVDLALHIDGFAALVAVLAAAVAACVQIYSTAYLRADPRYSSYAAVISLFTSAMLLVVYAGDLMLLLVGWEVMGICSYFLIGHYWETPEARAASLKAFLVTKLGDVPFLIGLFALASDAGTFRIQGVLAAAARGGIHHPTLVALLLLAGVAGKSAQFPLHTWLPDAMAGPTPVSALIHAATMVAAGVYLVARLLPVFTASTAALAVLAAMAALTMVGSGLAALAQDDIKRVLAYSTVGQLGYMFGALALGDRDAAVFHLLSHGVFKALLFLAAGVAIHATGTNSLAAMSRMGGLRRRIPDAFWTMTAGLLALAAIPPFSGFFSKESVLGSAEHTAVHGSTTAPVAIGWTVLLAGLATALLTGAYATRLWLLAFRGRGPEAPDHGPQPAAMNAVLWVLAVPTVGLGPLAWYLGDWFGGSRLTPSLTTSVLGTGVSVAGGVALYSIWRRTAPLAPGNPMGSVAAHPLGEPALSEAEAIEAHPLAYGSDLLAPGDAPPGRFPAPLGYAPDPADPGRLFLGPLHRHAAAGFHLDDLYDLLLVRTVRAGARLVGFLDREVLDTYVRGAGTGTRWLGAAVRRAQTGNAQTYLSVLLAGSVALAIAAVLVAAGA